MTPTHPLQPAEAILFMHSGDCQRARYALRALADSLIHRKKSSLTLESLFPAYRILLRRRGYFVESTPELTQSLREIQSLGPGFDLYDLAEDLAALDVLFTQTLRLSSRPLFPDLVPFAPLSPDGIPPKFQAFKGD